MASWTTDTIKPRERLSFGRGIVCKNVFNISSEAPPELFSSRITAHSPGPLRFATCENSRLEQYLVQRLIALQQVIPRLLRYAAEAVAL